MGAAIESIRMRSYDYAQLKNIAFIALSDAKMINRRVLKLNELARALHVDCFDYAAPPATLGYVSRKYGNIEIAVSDKLSKLEKNYEKAILLSTVILYDLNNVLPARKVLTHTVDDDDLFESAKGLASLMLTYKLTDRELNLFTDTKFEKKISQLAHKKGLPTVELLKRVVIEM